MSEERSSLSADSPLKHPNEDELGYARFAEQLAHAVVRMAPNDGLVMSVNGSWGSGKSTVMPSELYHQYFARTKRNIACTQPRVFNATASRLKREAMLRAMELASTPQVPRANASGP